MNLAKLSKSPGITSRSKGRGKGKKGESKGSGKEPRAPKSLIGCNALTKAGKRFCFGYNLGTYKEDARAGQECKHGLHACMKPGCGKPDHGACDHK